MNSNFSISNLSVSIEDKSILNGVSMVIKPGQVVAIMGPNGSGKSTLASTIMGHPSCNVTGGSITFNGQEITSLSVEERARAGIFLAFQYPYEIEGVVFKDFLRASYNALYAGTDKQIGIKAFNDLLNEKLALLDIPPDFATRHLNVGFSGGEKKRAEMLQIAVLQPKLVILDEIDSGLDVDALRLVSSALTQVMNTNPDMSCIVITHYQRILEHIIPDQVHVMQGGLITQSGGKELAFQIEKQGYK